MEQDRIHIKLARRTPEERQADETRRLDPFMRALKAIHTAATPETMNVEDLEKQRKGQELLGRLVEYRLAPEHPYPAAVEDAVKAWDYLMYQGYGARDVVVAGDSAGGNLALVLTHLLKEAGRRLPRALILLSPWTDMTASGKSYQERLSLIHI